MAGMLPVPPRNLADAAYMQGRSAEHLFVVIKDGSAAAGLSNAMPGFGGELGDEDVRNTVAYVQTLAAAQPAAPARAESETPAAEPPADLRITRLQLSIWPEYDDPRVLLIIRGELADGAAFPTHVTLPIPKNAELIGAGMISELGELLLHPAPRHCRRHVGHPGNHPAGAAFLRRGVLRPVRDHRRRQTVHLYLRGALPDQPVRRRHPGALHGQRLRHRAAGHGPGKRGPRHHVPPLYLPRRGRRAADGVHRQLRQNRPAAVRTQSRRCAGRQPRRPADRRTAC